MANDVLTILEQLRKTCATGMNYGNHPFDVIRYQEMLELIDQLYQRTADLDLAAIDPVETTGHITPKVGVNGIVLRDDGAILLEQRADDHCWGLPGGWAEVGLSAEENLLKEFLEETGYVVSVDELVGVMNRKVTAQYPYSSYHLLYTCSIVSGTIKVSRESVDVAWIHPAAVHSWHSDHQSWVEYVLQRQP